MPTFNVEEGYNLYADEYRNDHAHLDSFDWESARVWFQEALADVVRNNPESVVTDAGCGDGRTLARAVKWAERDSLFSKLVFQGLDLSREMLRNAAKRVPRAEFHRLDLTDARACRGWAESHRRADLLTSFFVLVHFSHPEDFFRSLSLLTVEGSIVLMNTIPQKNSPELSAHGKRFRIQAYHHEDDAVVQAGFDVGWTLVKRKNLVEKKQLISTLLWWRKQEKNTNSVPEPKPH